MAEMCCGWSHSGDVSQNQAVKLDRPYQMFPDFPEILGIFPQNLCDFPFAPSVYSLRAMSIVPLVLSPASKYNNKPTQLLTNTKGKKSFFFCCFVLTISSWHKGISFTDNIIWEENCVLLNRKGRKYKEKIPSRVSRQNQSRLSFTASA